jgi:dipeptidyl aminopeptidase/acylaminoacyl peptidase
MVDPDDGSCDLVASGALIQILGLSPDGRFALLRDGPRGAQHCWVLDRHNAGIRALLPYPYVGDTEFGVLRSSPGDGDPATIVAHLITDAGQPRPSLVAVPLDGEGRPGPAGTVAQRDDADLELVDADAEGRRVLLGWNVEGRSELDVLDTTSGECRRYGDLPGAVVAGGVLARDGSCAVLTIDGPLHPRRLWHLDLAGGSWKALTPKTVDSPGLVVPTLKRLVSHDGLPLSGWLYQRVQRTSDVTPRQPAMVSLHGGPESQERPVFNPQHQVLAAAGMVVFAPNIRGSSGFGRGFVHADDRYGRLDAIDDVAACAASLLELDAVDPDRVAVGGRSYGGYATLMAMARHPRLFAAGVDICGMSDLLTFYRDTEPWVARAAVTKYGDPVVDRALLARLSPLRYVEEIQAPVLVIHGERDTNVPVAEALQIVTALQTMGRPVEYLELEGEGHEYRLMSSRLRLLEAVTTFLGWTLSVPATSHPR